MARKSIIEIDVQDEKFQKFLKAYGDFEESVSEIPEAWKKLDSSIGSSNKKMSALSQAAAKSLGLSAKNAANLEKALQGASGATKNLDKNATRGASAFDKLGRSAHRAANIVGKLAGFAGKVGLLGAGIAGIGGGAALWGLTDLAGSAMRRQREALGAGVSPGTMASWSNYLKPVTPSAGNLLSRMAYWRQNPQERGWLSQIAPNWQKETVQQATASALLNIQRMAKQAKGSHNLIPLMQSRGGLQFMGNDWGALIRLQNMKTSTLRKYIGEAEKYGPSMGFSRGTAAAWTDLDLQMSAAGTRISSALIRALHPLAPAIAKLSNGLVNWITKTFNTQSMHKWVREGTKGIEEFTQFIGSKDFKKDVNNFVHSIRLLSAETYQVAKSMSWLIPKHESPASIMHDISKANNRYNLNPKNYSFTLQGMSLHQAVENAFQSILNQIPDIHVHVHNSTAARVDISTHAAARQQ